MDFSGMLGGGDPSLGGVLSPEQQAIASQYGLLAGTQMAGQLGMPTRTPVGIGATLGMIGGAMGQGRMAGAKNALELQQAGLQTQHLRQQLEGGDMANQLQRLTLGFYQDANGQPQGQPGQPGAQQPGPLSGGMPAAPGKGPAMAAGFGGGGILGGGPAPMQGAPGGILSGQPQPNPMGAPGVAPVPAPGAGLDPNNLIMTGRRMLRVPGMSAAGTSLIEQGMKMLDQGFSVGSNGEKIMAPGQAQFLGQTATINKNAANASDLAFQPAIAAATDKAKAAVALATAPAIAAATDRAKAQVALDTAPALEAAKTAAVNAVNAGKPLTPEQINGQEQSLSKTFQESEVYKRHMEASQAFKNVLASAKDDSAASDIALMDSVVKIFNPNAIVRQGSAQMLIDHAQGVPDRIIAMVKSYEPGNRAQFQKDTRGQLVTEAAHYMDSSRQIFNGAASFAQQQAQSQGLNPKNVVPKVLDPITELEGKYGLKYVGGPLDSQSSWAQPQGQQ